MSKISDIVISIEQAENGFSARVLNTGAVIVAQGETWREAADNILSAIEAHLCTFGRITLTPDP